MSKFFNAHDWYWYVGSDRTQAYSTKVGAFVPAGNPAFVAWQNDGTMPSVIATPAELGELLAPYSLRPTHAEVLAGYLDTEVDSIIVKKLFKIIFNMNNRLRVLEGQQPLTVAQARAAFRSLL